MVKQSMKMVVALILCLLPLITTAKQKPGKGFLFFKINRFDKNDKYHGRWKIYLGDNNQVIRNGRFKHGREVGIWKYYYPDGTRYMKEKYKRNSDLIEVTMYHENGKLARKGMAQFITTRTIDRYFWFGDWQVFDKEGNYSHTEVYKNGLLVSKR